MSDTESITPAEPASRGSWEREHAPVLSVTDWLVVNVVLLIPVVNVIMMIIWALDNHTNPNRGNFAKSYLIILAVRILIGVLFLGLFIGLIVRLVNNIGYSF